VFQIAGTAQTGKVQADFTYRLSKDGVAQAVTPGTTVALTEIGNGEYTVTAAGSTGFVSAAGLYVLQIIYTADPVYRWELTLVVGDGTFANVTGPAAYSTSSGAGRAMAGGSPLTAASAYVLSGSTIHATATTNASGLIGPVYLADGSYTLLIQKSGYTSASGTFTVTSGVAGAVSGDLTLVAAAVSSDTPTMGQMLAYARRMAGDNTGSKADAFLTEAIHEALDAIAQDVNQPWYTTEGVLVLSAPYSTGSVTASGAILTLSGGTFPTGADDQWHVYLAGQHYRVVSRDSGTQITLEAAPQETISGAAYVLYRSEYDLPSDILGGVSILYGYAWRWGVEPMPYAQLLAARRDYPISNPEAWGWSVRKDSLVLWPWPSAAAVVKFVYTRRPARPLITDTSTALDVPPEAQEAFRCAVDRALFRRGVYSGSAKPEETYAMAIGRMSNSDRRGRVLGTGLGMTRSEIQRGVGARPS
jgi:hypothetical protein